MPLPTLTVLALYIKYTKVNIKTDCHVWTGALGRGNYPIIQFKGVTHRAHRFFFKYFKAPKNMNSRVHLHHLCRNVRCVNSEHLEPILGEFHASNHRKERQLKNTCCNGHLYTIENTSYTKKGWRRCKTCDKATEKRRKH